MRLDSIEASFPAALPTAFPIRLVQTPSRAGSILKLIILLPASIALLTPFVLVGAQLVSNPAARAILSEQPQTGALLILALSFWGVLLGWPLKRIAGTVARLRTVSIFNGSVQVADSDVFGDDKWRAPITAFAGVAHNVRSSLSGVRHELVLVHREREKSILLAMAPRFSQSDIDALCRLLNTGEVSSKALYGFAGARTKPVAEVPQNEVLRAAA
jgi:hypothetical protein